MDLMTYVQPELVVLVAALYGLGLIMKKAEKIKDNFIPVILCAVSLVLSCLYILATEGVTLENVFNGIVQGFVCAAAAVFCNQIYKQSTKEE